MLPIASSAFQLCSGAFSAVTAPMNSALGLPNNNAASRYIPPIARTATAVTLLGCDDGQMVAGLCVAGAVGVAALWVAGQRLFSYLDRVTSAHSRNRLEALKMEVEFKRVAGEGRYQSAYEVERCDDAGVHWKLRVGTKQDLVGKDIIFLSGEESDALSGCSVPLHEFKIVRGRCVHINEVFGRTLLQIKTADGRKTFVRLTADGYESVASATFEGPVWYRDPVAESAG